MTHPTQVGFGSRTTTTLTGGGRSVVGNATVAYCVTTAAAVAFGIAFVVSGHPRYAVAGAILPYLGLFIFQHSTFRHVASNPDSSVTSEEHYARVQEARLAAKHPNIVRDEQPVFAVPENTAKSAGLITSDGGENA